MFRSVTKKIIIAFLLLCFVSQLSAQVKEIGLPFINNYSRKLYQAKTQNWDIAQDSSGVLYFANNGGVLSFNGSEWNIYPLPNGAIVRAVLCVGDKIYAAGFNEFGYFKKDEFGNVRYFSLSKDLPERDKDFDEIWRIFETDEGIVFQSYSNIFIHTGTEFITFEPRSRFGFSFMIDNELHVVDREFGLYVLKGQRLRPVILDDEFFYKNEVSFIIKREDYIFGTTNQGIFFREGKKIVPWGTDINQLFIENQIFSMLELNNEQMAIGTIQDGLYIIDFLGHVILHLNRSHGIQNNTVLSLFYDEYKNLWLGLDNGIDMLETQSPITMFNYSSNIETSYSTIVYKNLLYIGTNQGLFAKPLDAIHNGQMGLEGFSRVDGTLGQVWRLEIIDGKLFCGHNFGTFLIEGYQSTKMSDIAGGWDFQQIPWDKDYIIGGTYTGLNLYKKTNTKESWTDLGMITGIKESCKELYLDDDKNLWIIHGLKGVFKVNLMENLSSISDFKVYNQANGLPKLPYSMVQIGQKLLLLANDSLFRYEAEKDSFLFEKEGTALLTDIKGLTRIIADNNGDLWFFTKTNMGVLRLMEDGKYARVIKPFFRINNLFLRDPFENIYTIDSENTFIGSQEGIIHYSADYSKKYDKPFDAFLEEIKTYSRKTEDEGKDVSLPYVKQLDLTMQNISIPYKSSSVSFKYYAPFFEANNEIKYAFQLQGFDNEWSEWTNQTFKEYTNLDEGKYTFMVKAKNVFNNESDVCSYAFEVEPPFYRSRLAYAIYVLLFVALVVLNFRYFNKTVEKTRNIEQEKLVVKEREFKKEVEKSEQKIEKLEEEKINHEMRLKNIELANSTMNLIQKNKLLTNVKSELTSVADRAKIDSVKSDIKTLITKIDKDINHDKNFKLFDKYFDRVHQDFVNRLKDKHPNLTPKDLRLCAYLRMNLSTKEIAPLMNVSIRGLEISRYRLRKKLDLDHNANLVDYMMNV